MSPIALSVPWSANIRLPPRAIVSNAAAKLTSAPMAVKSRNSAATDGAYDDIASDNSDTNVDEIEDHSAVPYPFLF